MSFGTCILVRYLSDVARNVTVAPTQWRWEGLVRNWLTAASRARSGVSCFEQLQSSTTNPLWCRGRGMPR